MKPATPLLAAAILLCTILDAAADEIVFPSRVLERDGEVAAIYRLDRPATGAGLLEIEWTDVHGRLVERRGIPVTLDDGADIPIALDLTRAVAMANWLKTRLTLDSVQTETESYFVTAPPDDGWTDYQVIMWQNQGPAQYRALRQLGFSAGKVYAVRDDTLFSDLAGPLLENDMRWYIENIATDFYSAYHRWHPEKPNNWRFLEAKALYARDPDDIAAFIREPSLSDPAWLEEIRARLTATVRAYRPYSPLFYNLADEPGIAQTAAFWDFDLSRHSIDGMREWLRGQYGDLAALNAQWGSSYTAWDQVMPETTRDAVMRDDGNFSAWADFKAWMDVAFARAIRAGADAVHAGGDRARAGLEGMQIPGWGGYDYTLLADTVDVMEIYDYGENVEIARSLNPDLIILATLGGSGPRAEHAVWRDLLRGVRGVIFWDDKRQVVDAEGAVGERGRQAAGWIKTIRGGIGALLIGSQRHHDPIAMLYSPASQRTQWMLDVKRGGQDWSERDVDSEYADNPIRDATARFRQAIAQMGLQHRMVAPRQIEAGALIEAGYAVLLLPHAVALSSDAAKAILAFVAGGGTVVAAGEPGRFDDHSRRLARPLLADLFPPGPVTTTQKTAWGAGRAIRLADDAPAGGDMGAVIGPILAQSGVLPPFPLAEGDGRAPDDVETRVLRNGGLTLVAFQRNPPRVAEDGESRAVPLQLSLLQPAYVHDVLGQKTLGRVGHVDLDLDGVVPTILALSDTPLPAPAVTAPARIGRGKTGMIEIAVPGSPAARHVFRVEVIDPDGKPVRHYSGNALAAGGRISHALPIALNDPTGVWQVRVTDVASGLSTGIGIDVVPD